MRKTQEHRIISAVLRCYPARWRSRHGDEAAELASVLLRDGVAWWSIAASFLGGVARERVFRLPRFRVGPALAALMIGIAAIPLTLIGTLSAASATNTTVTVELSRSPDQVQQLQSALDAHHFKIMVVGKPVPWDLAGSIISVKTDGASSANADVFYEVHGHCHAAELRCVTGLVIPLHYEGSARVTVGVAQASESIRYAKVARTVRVQ